MKREEWREDVVPQRKERNPAQKDWMVAVEKEVGSRPQSRDRSRGVSEDMHKGTFQALLSSTLQRNP